LREVPADGGRRLDLPFSRAEDIARALRGALLHHAEDPPPAVLSGHEPDGRRLTRPHAAFVALPAMGPDGTVGGIAGAAILLPREIASQELQAVLLAAARWERAGLRLVLGRLGAMRLARCDGAAPGNGFGPWAWTGPSRRWASVTPAALHHNPGNLAARDPEAAARATRRAAAIVTGACAHIGLPAPVSVRVARRSRFPGVPSAPEFMPFPRNASGPERFQRVCVHVELEFAEPVEGPVLLGAGRYFGVGLCGATVHCCEPSAMRPRQPTGLTSGS
jgi:CRISPR-associated protein Csb2